MQSGARRQRGCSFHEELDDTLTLSSNPPSSKKADAEAGSVVDIASSRRQQKQQQQQYKGQADNKGKVDLESPFLDFDDFDIQYDKTNPNAGGQSSGRNTSSIEDGIKYCDDNGDGNDNDDDDDNDDSNSSQEASGNRAKMGRRRSRSFHDDDDLYSLCDDNTTSQSSSSKSESSGDLCQTPPSASNAPPKTRLPPSPTENTKPILIGYTGGNSPQTRERARSIERSGPLLTKEIAALQKGLEEAEMAARSSLDEVRSLSLSSKILNIPESELELERIDAEMERNERLGSFGTGSPRTSSFSGDRAISASMSSPGGTILSADNNLRRIKILVLGDSGVGKSSLIMRWTTDQFKPNMPKTVGVNFKNKRTTVDGENIIVQVWDTAGQAEFHKITQSYYKGANGIMILYDISCPQSLKNIDYWIKAIKENANEGVHVILVGNKSDLRRNGDSNYVNYDAGYKASSNCNLTFIETSAGDSKNVENAFIYLARQAMGSDGRVALAPTASKKEGSLLKLLSGNKIDSGGKSTPPTSKSPPISGKSSNSNKSSNDSSPASSSPSTSDSSSDMTTDQNDKGMCVVS